MIPPRHVSKVLRWRRASRPERVAAGTPSPRVSQVAGQVALYQLDYMLADVRQKFEGVSTKVSGMSRTACHEKITYPLSPVARMKFFHLGCSQISSAASAVSVHQQSALLKSSLSLKRGRNVEMALLMVTSDASG